MRDGIVDVMLGASQVYLSVRHLYVRSHARPVERFRKEIDRRIFVCPASSGLLWGVAREQREGVSDCASHTRSSRKRYLIVKGIVAKTMSFSMRQKLPCLATSVSQLSFGTKRASNKITSSAKRWGHSVRLIALEDLPYGKGYQGDVVTVKAGYARNFLIPQKKAVYATPQNFEKFGVVDPEFETEAQRLARLERESSMNKTEEQYLKQADVLKKYLRNKVVSEESIETNGMNEEIF